jgi:TolB protein
VDDLKMVNLTNHPASDYQPQWSPDAKRIVFVSSRDDANGEIYVMNDDGSGVTRLTDNVLADHSPDWSPDGQHILFTRITEAMRMST